MNAAPISVNSAAGNNPSTGANGEASKASTLLPFSQVMAEKQAASTPRENGAASAEGMTNAANGAVDAGEKRSSDSTATNPGSDARGVADSAKKGDSKGKGAKATSASKGAPQSFARIQAEPITQVAAILPGLNVPLPRVVSVETGNAAAQTAEVPTNKLAGVDAAVTAGPIAGQEQPRQTLTSELPDAKAGKLQDVPVIATSARAVPVMAGAKGETEIATGTLVAQNAPATPEVAAANGATTAVARNFGEEQSNGISSAAMETPNDVSAAIAALPAQALPVAGKDPATETAIANLENSAGSQVAPVTSEPNPGDLNADAATAPKMDLGAAKPQDTPKVQAGRGVEEILQGGGAITGDETQAVAQASSHSVGGTVSVSKGKSGGNTSAAVSSTGPSANGKREMPVGGSLEPAIPEVAETPEKRGGAKNGISIKGNSNAEDGANEDGNFEASGTTAKDFGLSMEPNAVHGATPTGLSDPSNPGANAAMAVPAPNATVGKDSASAMPGKAGTAPNNTAPAAPDADDAVPQPNESRVVNVAQLAGDPGHSQVRIAMQADQLGQVEVHATVRGQQVGAAITVEKKEAHAALAAEMPSLQQSLEERQFRVGEVVLMQGAMHSTAGDAGNAAAEQQRRGQAGTTYQQVESETQYETGLGAIFESNGIFDDSGRLSVRA
ncbi:MAG TPA: flagellar hook-length control protein FliK [Candidatus Acidoferrum sp.]|nr:flagellar hook-length control protein FliK [Candidatus Acidoferrum sp.]